MSQEEISSQQIDGGFLIEQMELREKLESMHGLVDPDTVLEHLVNEIAGDIKMHQAEFAQAYDAARSARCGQRLCQNAVPGEITAVEAEQIESDLMDRSLG